MRLLGRMPFLSSSEIVRLLKLDGAENGDELVRNLVGLGFVTFIEAAGVKKGGWGVKRYALTAEGIRRLGVVEGLSVDEVMERYPVDLRWRRTLLKRLEGLELFYKLCCLVMETYGDRNLVADDSLSTGSSVSLVAGGLAGWDDKARMGGSGSGHKGDASRVQYAAACDAWPHGGDDGVVEDRWCGEPGHYCAGSYRAAIYRGLAEEQVVGCSGLLRGGGASSECRGMV